MKYKNVKLSIMLFGRMLTTLQAQTVKDIDGNVYQTIRIGTQTWMKENLKVTHYGNGDVIGTTTPDTMDICSESTPKYQWVYNGKESNVATYGRLYTWYAVTDSRNICPIGWHVPNDTEWSTLVRYLGFNNKLLKDTDTVQWISRCTKAINESGFSVLSGCNRNCCGLFFNIGSNGSWWSSSDNDFTSKEWRLGFYIGYPIKSCNEEANGLPVRCIKD